MSIFTFKDGSVEIRKNNIIFSEGQSTQSINILLQGEVDVYISPFDDYEGLNEDDILKKSFRIFTIDQNMLIGSGDMFLTNNYTYSYQASKDSMIYVFCLQAQEDFNNFLLSHKDYGAYIMTSICNSIIFSYSAMEKINALISRLDNLNSNLALYFWYLKEKHGFDCKPTSLIFENALKNYNMLDSGTCFEDSSLESFLLDHKCPAAVSDYNNNTELQDHLPLYYKSLVNIPMELRKSFYAADNYVTTTQCKDASAFLNKIQKRLKNSLNTLSDKLSELYSTGSEGIFPEYLKAASGLDLRVAKNYEVFQVLDFIFEKIQELSGTVFEEYKFTWIENMKELSYNIDCIKAGSKSSEADAERVFNNNNLSTRDNIIPEELIDSSSKIIEFSGISCDKAELFFGNLEAYIALKDKTSQDETANSIKKSLTTLFFEIYEAAVKKVIIEGSQSRLIHMFLTFGYMDERLLEPEQTCQLYSLIDNYTAGGNDSVYSMRDWLSSIHNMQKDPSMNEFSQDYTDIFRELKKRREVTDKDWPSYYSDRDARLGFEVNNMFKVNHKSCYGHVGSYFPILNSSMITRDISKSIITPANIKEAIEKLLETDFTIFHREISYQNPERGIEKELIMKPVLPDVILIPIFGSRASMWQEISGRNRSTPGRFIIPIMLDDDLNDIIVKLAGNYRWELCRTMMGVYWNDITQKSLTSEYTDYIQFYKKNREIPEDVKGKIASQVVKYRSMMRDIFTSDYEQWINYESKGIIRLNKVSRSIMYKYCPFPKATREKLSKHPMFSDLEAHFNIMAAKRLKEINNHYIKLQKSGITPDRVMEDNLMFHMSI